MSVKVFGVPALYAKKIRNEAMVDCAKFGALAGISVLVAYAYYKYHAKFPLYVLVVPLITCLYSLHKYSIARVGYIKASVGIRAEVKVSKILSRCAPHALVNGSLLGSHGDIDHIVVGPCLVSVETKYGAGPVGLDANGNLVCGKKLFKGNPIEQARRASAAVSKYTGFKCNPVVVVTGSTSKPFISNGVTVCSASDLVSVLSAFPAIRVSQDQAALIAQRLHTAK